MDGVTDPLSELPPVEVPGDEPTRVPGAIAAGYLSVAAVLAFYGWVNLLVLDPYDSQGASMLEIVFDPDLWSKVLVYASSYLAIVVGAALAAGVAGAAILIRWRRPARARTLMLFGPAVVAVIVVVGAFFYWSAS